MINGLEGLMGGGKSYEAVRYHVLPALQKGRKVITNLPLVIEVWEQLFPDLVHLIEIRTQAKPVLGRWDAEAANRGEQAFRVGEFEEEERLKLVNGKPYLTPENTSKPPFSGVWCFYDTWRGANGVGPLYVIDECHVSFPKPKPLKGIQTPPEIIQYFKLSRHFGVDILLATQRFKSVDEDISGLIQIHHRVQKAIAFGDPGSYIKKTLNGYRGEQISVSTRKYEGFYFKLYKSHTQGEKVSESEAEDVTPFIKKWRVGTRLYLLFTAAVFVWAFWPDSKPEPKHVQQFKQQLSTTPPGKILSQDEQGNPVHLDPKDFQPVAPKPTASGPAAPAPAQPPVVEPPKKFEPLEGKTVHLTGWSTKRDGTTVYIFEVAKDNQRIFTSDSIQLAQAGYRFKPLGECMGILTYEDVSRPVSCDAPRIASGHDNKPIVITDPAARVTGPAAPAAHAPREPEPDYPHPFTAASKTARLAGGGVL